MAVGPIEDVVGFDASLAPRVSLDVTTQVGGEVSKVLVGPGDRVEEGRILARLSNPEVGFGLEAARLAVREAELEVAAAQRRLSRREALAAKGFVGDEELADLRWKLERARVALDRARLQRDQAAQRASALVLRSPVAGMVSVVGLGPVGSRVGPGTLAFRIVTPEELVARLRVTEARSEAMAPGNPVTVTKMTPDRVTVQGEIIALAPVLDPQTGLREVTVLVPNPDGRLIPGGLAHVSLVVARRERALLAPAMAVRFDGDRARVFRVEGGQARLVEVGLGIRGERVVEVTSGLEPGDRVVVAGQQGLHDGSRVRVFTSSGEGG